MAFLPGERERKPMTIGVVADLSFEAYGARLGLYTAIAAAFFLIQLAVQIVSHGRGSAFALTNDLADAAIAGAVASGVAATIAGDDVPWRTLFVRTFERLWMFFLLELAAGTVMPEPSQIFGSAAETLYGFGIIPALFVGGISQLPVVAAALETEPLRGSLLARAVVSSLRVAFRLQAFPRIALLGLVVLAEGVLQGVLYDVLHAHGVPYAMFWSGVPVDMLVVGPIAAFSTVLYLDLRKRAER